MRFTGSSKVLVCKEFEPLEIPYNLLFSSGQVSIYPGVDKYFDIDYRGGKIVIAPKSYVGLIPVNDELSINVIPRFSIEKLFYFIRKSSTELRFIEGHDRYYCYDKSYSEDPLEVLVRKFSKAASSISQLGLLKNYRENEDFNTFSGSIDFNKTVASFRSCGTKYISVWRAENITSNLVENRLVKSALVRVADYLKQKNSKESRKYLQELMPIYSIFKSIEPLEIQYQLHEKQIVDMIKRLPAFQIGYRPILWLSYLIHMRVGIAIEQTGYANFDTFVINLADVFEGYIRTIVRDYFRQNGSVVKVSDGNIDQRPLFRNCKDYMVKPDIYLSIGVKDIAVVDAKYKPSIKANDRYEVIAFCEALQAKTAIIVSPFSNEMKSELLGVTPGGIRFLHFRIDLSSTDIKDEEKKILKQIHDLLI